MKVVPVAGSIRVANVPAEIMLRVTVRIALVVVIIPILFGDYWISNVASLLLPLTSLLLAWIES